MTLWPVWSKAALPACAGTGAARAALRGRWGAVVAGAFLRGQPQVEVAVPLARLDVRALEELVEAGEHHRRGGAVDHRLPCAAVVGAVRPVLAVPIGARPEVV